MLGVDAVEAFGDEARVAGGAAEKLEEGTRDGRVGDGCGGRFGRDERERLGHHAGIFFGALRDAVDGVDDGLGVEAAGGIGEVAFLRGIEEAW